MPELNVREQYTTSTSSNYTVPTLRRNMPEHYSADFAEPNHCITLLNKGTLYRCHTLRDGAVPRLYLSVPNYSDATCTITHYAVTSPHPANTLRRYTLP